MRVSVVLAALLASVASVPCAAAAVPPPAPTGASVALLAAGGRAGRAGDGAGADASANPAIAMYRRRTLQYEKDAKEAEKAAAMYAKMAQDAVKQSVQDTKAIVPQEFGRIGLDTWAHAAWQFEQMLTDPKPGLAAKAAAKAAKPYNEAYAEYAKAQASYNSAAAGYAIRAGMDQKEAKKLQTYSDQYHLQGNKELGDKYGAEATLLMKQAENFQGFANNYQGMAQRIFGALPTIQNMAGQAGAYAAWEKNPTNNMPAAHVFPFTITPPLEFVQVGAASLRR